MRFVTMSAKVREFTASSRVLLLVVHVLTSWRETARTKMDHNGFLCQPDTVFCNIVQHCCCHNWKTSQETPGICIVSATRHFSLEILLCPAHLAGVKPSTSAVQAANPATANSDLWSNIRLWIDVLTRISCCDISMASTSKTSKNQESERQDSSESSQDKNGACMKTMKTECIEDKHVTSTLMGMLLRIGAVWHWLQLLPCDADFTFIWKRAELCQNSSSFERSRCRPWDLWGLELPATTHCVCRDDRVIVMSDIPVTLQLHLCGFLPLQVASVHIELETKNGLMAPKDPSKCPKHPSIILTDPKMHLNANWSPTMTAMSTPLTHPTMTVL